METTTLLKDGELASPNKDTMLFEIAWEVAKKVGGIYTVIRSKAYVTSMLYGDRYTIICPYVEKYPLSEFEILEPSSPAVKLALGRLSEKHGIKYKFAKWLVKGYPYVILLETDSSRNKLHDIKNEVNYSLNTSDPEVADALLFGFQVALFFQELAAAKKETQNDLSVVAQFHEWMASVGLILSRRWNTPIATIFTTHATLLGRYLSAGKIDFYHNIEKIDIDKEAGIRQIYDKHWIEKGAALGAHSFTTVSDITAYEAKFILGREATAILPNGLQVDKFEALHEFQNLHATNKKVINEFVRGHFYGFYDFDLENTVYIFTSGRYEVFNKGIDMFLEGLARLNWKLKEANSKITVVGFIITNAGPKVNNFNVESLKGQSIMRELRKDIDQMMGVLSERIFEATAQGKLISSTDLLHQEELVKLKSRIATIKQRSQYPPIVTHNIDDSDEILNLIRQKNLLNAPEDRVKIIYHPEFLNSFNPLIPLDYNDFVRGCHLGVFPSYYEPWGYTPAECAVMGVPSITSNLTGFANFMQRKVDDPAKHGLYVVDRQFISPEESMQRMTEHLWKFCQLSRRQRIELRNKTERLSSLLDWSSLNEAYESARKQAKEWAFPPTPDSSKK